MLALRVIVYASAFVCCNIEFHISRVCRFHVCFAFGIFVCLFVFACLFCVCLRMFFPLYVAILRFILHAGFAFVPFVSLCVIACFILRVIVYALAFCMLEGCVSLYTCV